MNSSSSVQIPELSLPKGGGALRGLGDAVSVAGATGVAAFSFPLPISAGRGVAPALGLNYNSGAGNGTCGIGWSLPSASISLDLSDGVPSYSEADTVLGPGGERLLPELNEKGRPVFRTVTNHPRFKVFAELRGVKVFVAHQVQRYWPQVQGAFDRIERWTPESGGPSFWLVQAVDGSLHLYGRTVLGRIADPEHADTRIAQWLLEASLSVSGEQIRYEYVTDEHLGSEDGRDCKANRYLKGIRYGNRLACQDLCAPIDPKDWHFNIVLDYRSTQGSVKTSLEWEDAVTVRKDAFSRYSSGFEVRTRRLCRQVLMYHRFAELDQNNGLVLVNRTELAYAEQSRLSRLESITTFGRSEDGREDSMPPVTFQYSYVDLAEALKTQHFTPMPGLSGLDAVPYQLVDLYGEGVAGILLQDDTGWRYRAPQRNSTPDTLDGIGYADWQPLPEAPVGQASTGGNRVLADLSGDALLDWVITEPGMQGFFSQRSDKTWSDFTPFAAFPVEFFHPKAQLASLVGGAYQDLVLIGPKSVRLYNGLGAQGFAAARDIDQEQGISLPLSGGVDEVVAFSDMLGTGQQHLVRIRHDSVSCWPNLGHGRFGQPISLAAGCVFDSPGSFNPSRVFLADLLGLGVADLIYAHTDYLAIYRNHSGNHLDLQPIKLPFPEGVQFDDLSLLQFADNHGLGCANLILTLPQRGEQERHWCFDFTGGVKPYLLTTVNNHQGLRSQLTYRSSAQAWLDDKAAGSSICHLPFSVHTVASLTHHDAISGNQLTQVYGYHHGYYDRQEREFRGFGLVEHTDTEQRAEPGSVRIQESHLAPVLTRTWYHQGTLNCGHDRTSYCQQDPESVALGATLYIGLDGKPLVEREQDEPSDVALKNVQRTIMARALAGSVLRTEVTGVAQADQTGPVPLYTASEARYRACLLTFQNEYAAIVLPQALESLSYQYDCVPSDPICSQQITLDWDPYGMPLHSVSVHYPRRLTQHDEPPAHHTEEWEKTWWRDSHDPSQQMLRLSESRQRWYHLDQDPDNWRLGLPKQTRSDVLELQVNGSELERGGRGFKPLLSYERLSTHTAGNLLWEAPQGTWQMTGMQVLHYYDDQGMDGEPTLQGLLHHSETAELDALALSAYERVLEPTELTLELNKAGYHLMTWLMADERDSITDLWGIKTDFCTYENQQGFYRLSKHRLSDRITEGTRFTYDRYGCQVQTVTNALGHVSHAYYDYRTLQPLRIVDLNDNKQEAVYDGLGRVLATTFYGTETVQTRGSDTTAETSHTVTTGFHPLYDSHPDEHNTLRFVSRYQRSALTLESAIKQLENGDITGHPDVKAGPCQIVLGGWATAIYYDVHSWFTQQTPVHTATFVADRYPEDLEGQVRVSIAYLDGFGRAVQTKIKVEPGKSYCTDNEKLILEDASSPSEKQLVKRWALMRWLVSGRVEYNNKGLPVRSYQPYFLDTYRYVSDTALRGYGYSTRIDYDPLGRAVKTVRPDGYFQRQSYWPWYVIGEDENDTAGEREVSVPVMTVH